MSWHLTCLSPSAFNCICMVMSLWYVLESQLYLTCDNSSTICVVYACIKGDLTRYGERRLDMGWWKMVTTLRKGEFVCISKLFIQQYYVCVCVWERVVYRLSIVKTPNECCMVYNLAQNMFQVQLRRVAISWKWQILSLQNVQNFVTRNICTHFNYMHKQHKLYLSYHKWDIVETLRHTISSWPYIYNWKHLVTGTWDANS